MSMTLIESSDDERIASYRNLKDRELAVDGGLFIAESEHVVRRLLASDFVTESVLVARRRAEAFSQIVPEHVKLYVAADELMHEIVGFKFHSGVIACGRRRYVSNLSQLLRKEGRSLVVICPDLISHSNLGGLIRIASAFGADGMVLGERCCDPFYRLCVRVSMGTIFRLPLFRSAELEADLREMKSASYELLATVLSADAESIDDVRAGERMGILFGNEAQGLAENHLSLCDRRVRIPMLGGTDSLNVTVAAGIFLYQFARR